MISIASLAGIPPEEWSEAEFRAVFSGANEQVIALQQRYQFTVLGAEGNDLVELAPDGVKTVVGKVHTPFVADLSSLRAK